MTFTTNPPLSFSGPDLAAEAQLSDEPAPPDASGDTFPAPAEVEEGAELLQLIDDIYAVIATSATSPAGRADSSSLLAELEEPTAPATSGIADDLDELDALLSASMDAAREAKTAKAVRAKVRKLGWSAVEPEDAERIRRWELANEWQAVANVALFNRFRCKTCGRQQTVFGQLLLKQEHRHLRDTARWQATDTNRADLPSEVVVQKWESPMCTECAHRAGFEMGKGKVTEGKGGGGE